jgi:hypothetical protein
MLSGKHRSLNVAEIFGPSEHGEDSAGESAYRRGYTHGARAMIVGLGETLSIVQRQHLDTWLKGNLTPWSHSTPAEWTQPPEFPKV